MFIHNHPFHKTVISYNLSYSTFFHEKKDLIVHLDQIRNIQLSLLYSLIWGKSLSFAFFIIMNYFLLKRIYFILCTLWKTYKLSYIVFKHIENSPIYFMKYIL